MTAPARAPSAVPRKLPLEPSRLLMALLVFVPLAPIAAASHWGALLVFTFACLAILPLAGILGEATERLAARLRGGGGALPHATLGDPAELLLAPGGAPDR